MDTGRRSFIRLLGGVGALSAAYAASGRRALAQTRAKPLSASELRDGLILVSGAGCNVLMLNTPEGLAMVDSGSAASAAELAAFVAERSAGMPVTLLFNTHWHTEHTGGNDTLAGSGTTIVAHENTRLWMGTKVYVEWEDRRYGIRDAAALPNKTFFSSDPQPIEVSIANQRMVYGHLPAAHTDGDIFVAFPEHNVIAAGGVVTSGRYPVPDYVTGGWIGGVAEATQTLIDMADSSTLIIPASGPPLQRSDLEAQHEMLVEVRRRIEEMALVGKGIDEMISDRITEDFDARFGADADLFISNSYQGLWWGGRLRGAVA